MSIRLEGEKEPPITTTTAAADAHRPSLASLPHLTTWPRRTTRTSVPSTLLRASVDDVAVPLERYRAKLEECAALHDAVANLTRRSETSAAHLAEQLAENARLRELVAELQGRLAGGADTQRGARSCTCASCPGSVAEEGEQLASTSSASPPAVQVAESVAAAARVRSRRRLTATTVTPASCTLTRQLRSSSQAVAHTSSMETASAEEGGSCSTMTRDDVSRGATQHSHDRHSPLPSAASSGVRTGTSRTSSSSSSCSVSGSDVMDDASDDDGDLAMTPQRRVSRQRYVARLSAAEAMAYARAMGSIAVAPLGPWEE